MAHTCFAAATSSALSTAARLSWRRLSSSVVAAAAAAAASARTLDRRAAHVNGHDESHVRAAACTRTRVCNAHRCRFCCSHAFSAGACPSNTTITWAPIPVSSRTMSWIARAILQHELAPEHAHASRTHHSVRPFGSVGHLFPCRPRWSLHRCQAPGERQQLHTHQMEASTATVLSTSSASGRSRCSSCLFT